ncbi:hypothetical protein [Bacillus sp. FJAT-49736]|uniref:hypothetical protein n=1 Tax=Bacillus sp. FJAT-49736 TaxID=2833582 RepID=UPI001BC902CF|nr:hypothetical protein [Bacillus sp. FJAT-49736]MBS4172614.1 hypothetical protein [Bacillus sp. FJAT-49736]
MKWNEEAAPNNNIPSEVLQTSKFASDEQKDHEFSEELSDGGERDEAIKRQMKNNRKM